jgi:hypothetical protein
MRISTSLLVKYSLIVGCLISFCCISVSHALPKTKTFSKVKSKAITKTLSKFQTYRVVVVNCIDRYAEVKDGQCVQRRVGLSAKMCSKVKLGHQVILKNNQISSVLGAYKSWGGKVKVVNSIDRYLEIKSCEAQCRIGATPALLRGVAVNQTVNAILTRPLTWSGGTCSGNAQSIARR